jgi:hypothetical protein
MEDEEKRRRFRTVGRSEGHLSIVLLEEAASSHPGRCSIIAAVSVSDRRLASPILGDQFIEGFGHEFSSVFADRHVVILGGVSSSAPIDIRLACESFAGRSEEPIVGIVVIERRYADDPFRVISKNGDLSVVFIDFLENVDRWSEARYSAPAQLTGRGFRH